MKPIDVTIDLRRAAAMDAGNRNMRAAGRTQWNMDDVIAANDEYARLMIVCPDPEQEAILMHDGEKITVTPHGTGP